MDKNQNRTDETAEQKTVFTRRDWMKLAASGVTLPGFFASNASATDSFVDLLSADPSDYPNIQLNMSVDTEAGRNGELTEDAFTIIEEGVEREIQNFSFGSAESDIVFVFDDTGSMGDEIDGLKTKVADLIDDIEAAGVNARYGLVTFKDDIETDLKLDGDTDRLKSAVNGLSARGGGDSPEDNFDAIVRALNFDYRDEAQKVIIDITDALSHYEGDGSGFTDYTIDEVADKIRDRGAAYVAVSPGYDDEDASKENLAELVNGHYVDIDDGDFTTILSEIIEFIVTAYVIEYGTDLAIGAAGVLSVIVEDPDRGTSNIDGTVTIPSDIDGLNLDRLYSEKRTLISSIRDTAGSRLIGESADGYPSVLLLSPDNLDTEASSYLDRLDQNGDGEVELDTLDRQQAGESLERLVNIENVTEAAVSAPIEDRGSGAIIDRQVEAAVDVIKTLSIEAVARGAGEAINVGLTRALEDDVVNGVLRKVENIGDDLSTTGKTSGRGTSSADDDQQLTFDELNSRLQDDTLANADDPKDWAEEGTEGLIQGRLEPATDTFDAIDETASTTTETIAALEYQKYLDGGASGSAIDLLDDLGDFEPPSYEFDIPDSVDINVPGSDLANDGLEGAEDASNALSGAIDSGFDSAANISGEDDLNVYNQDGEAEFGNIPDEITFDFLEEIPDEIDLGEIAGVETIQNLSDLVAEVSAIPDTSINPSIDQLVERIVEDAENGELSLQSESDRETLLEIANTVLESTTDGVDFALNQLETLSDVFSEASKYLAYLTIISALIGLAATGGAGSIISLSTLGTASLVLLGLQVLVDRGRFFFAEKSVQIIGGTHSATGALLTYTDLTQVGGGN